MKINRKAIYSIRPNIIKVSINAKSFHSLYAPHKKGTCPNFRQRPMSDIAYYCGLASDILNKSRLNCKLKISNMSDNTGIT